MILPDLETEVLVINSFLSILIEKSKRRGHRGRSSRLILRYDSIRYDMFYTSIVCTETLTSSLELVWPPR